MRPVVTPQSAIRAPLNRILSTEANVRILRVLCLGDQALGKSTLAAQAGLNASGVGRSITALEELGIVAYAGTGPGRGVSLRSAHPLASVLRKLFTAERDRFDEIATRLSEIARILPGPPVSVWIEGPVATAQDTIGDPLVLGVLVPAKDIEAALQALAAPIDLLSDDLDVTIDCKGFTSADLTALHGRDREALDTVITVFGVPPTLLLGRWKPVRPHKAHAGLDADALRRAEAIAEIMKRDPGIVDRARAYIRGRAPAASGNERKELAEWERLLSSSSLPRLRRSLVADTEQGRRLRQSMPFVEALEPHQRLEVEVRTRATRK